MGLLSIIGIAVMLSFPIVLRSHRHVPTWTATKNARSIGIALFEFEKVYGSYPDASTVAMVRKSTGNPSLGAKTSNDFLRHLIGAGMLRDEARFYAPIAGARKPDNRIDGSHALRKGECGFSYIVGLSPRGNPSQPILVTPLIPGTDRFDPKPFEGYAIILRLDCSATRMRIRSDGRVMSDGMNLLDPANPVWGKDKWTIAWPE